jgi:hypothetical protein
MGVKRVESTREVVADLAQRTRQPAERVERVYKEQLAIIGKDAKVTQFVALLAKRRAQEILIRH